MNFMQKIFNKTKNKKQKMSQKEFEQDRDKYIRLNKDSRFQIDKQYDYVCLYDKYDNNGSGIDNGYFIQDIWGARKVIENKPSIHYDVGSSVNGFIAHLLAAKIKVVLFDIRAMEDNKFDTDFLKCNDMSGIYYTQTNATNLEEVKDNSVDSLSALCSVEHFGLGRYGDPIEPDAWEKALRSFQRVLKTGGKLYFSVPIGNENRVCFNAHRVFKPETIIEIFESDGRNCMKLLELSYINNFDVKNYYENPHDKVFFESNGAVGLFEFVKN
ncbi:DUF268 domain-containing protein [Campylobacter jejuni]|uniref:DUF268 domain-containing protein n=1 Tax=Campylobacter jejuni TaxID=197 RepID=UPI002043740B|nr:DUF268 domain-containing protein [Campylobacter jejuni]